MGNCCHRRQYRHWRNHYLPSYLKMKKLFKSIKGILLLTLIVGTFCLNLNTPTPINSIETKHETDINASIENLMIPNVKAVGGEGEGEGGEEAKEERTVIKSFSAEDIEKLKEAKKLPEEITKTISKTSSLINLLFNPLIFFITKQIGGLLSNDYIFGGGMGDMLHAIWIVSRNIVNIVFVLILLFLALKHIFVSDENSDLKKVLPKFVIMLIAINFSWLGVKLVLDAANVATNVVFSIPSGVKGGLPESMSAKLDAEKCEPDDTLGFKSPKGSCYLSEAYYPFDAYQTNHFMKADCDAIKIADLYKTDYPKEGDVSSLETTVKGYSTLCWEDVDIGKFAPNNAAYHLTYSMAGVQKLSQARTGDPLDKIAIGTLFSLIIQIIYLVSFGSLFIALIFRVAALWFMVAFSPFLVLIYYLSSIPEIKTDGVSSKFSFSELGKWAFAPAKVGAVWSIGFIMITTGQGLTKNFFEGLNEYGGQVFSVNSLFMGMESIQELMWLIMTIGIIWMGTFAVLGELPVIGEQLKKIGDYGTGLAKDIARSPTWAPIVPMIDPNTNKLTFGSASSRLPDPRRWLRRKEEYQSGKVSDTHAFEDADKKFKKASAQELAKLNNATTPKDKLEAFRAITGLSVQQIKDNPTGVQRILEANKVSDHAKVANQIIEGAKGVRPQDVSVDPLNKGTGSQSQAMTQRQFEESLRRIKLKADLSETDKANIRNKAGEIKGQQPNLSHDQAIEKAARELRHLAEEDAAKKEPPKGEGSNPPDQPPSTQE